MATARPVVSVYNHEKKDEKTGSMPMPHVLTTPLRPDLVRSVHTNVSKNKRQAYAVYAKAGYETAAESWGTGRAVARVPRVPGGGTHRSGQGAFGNMCRGGGMFCPTKTWRRWHRRVNVNQKRHAVVSALAASSLPPLVMARGHRIGEEVSELPLVVSNDAEGVEKTKAAIEMLKTLGCEEELKKVSDSKKIRSGKGKMRNRRYVMRRGPLVVYNEDNGIVRALRNVPGVETASVNSLNLLQVAPGGNFGRFIIWTEGAFKKLGEIYGSLKGGSSKKGYRLPRAAMENADVARIINSDEVQSVLKPKLDAPKGAGAKKNALKNKMVAARLNPGILQKKAARKNAHAKDTAEGKLVQGKKKARIAASKDHNKKHKTGDATYYRTLMKAFEAKTAKAEEADE